jgi:hypothetical protein
MQELHAPRLSHLKGGKVTLSRHKIIKIQDHGVVALVHTNPTRQRTPQSSSLFDEMTPKI